jgi:MinD-like ATPase involved in chromosome partitioning or flagellar assembly
MDKITHLDELGTRLLSLLLARAGTLHSPVLLIHDVRGGYKVVFRSPTPVDHALTATIDELNRIRAQSTQQFEIWADGQDVADPLAIQAAWDLATSTGEELATNLWLLERVQNRDAWFDTHFASSNAELSSRVVAFYSYKGGSGRTTALASFALDCAMRGERVVIIDLDLDAPGIGPIFDPDEVATNWGVVDYLIELRGGNAGPIRDYGFSVADAALVASGEIFVIPAGMINHDFLGKLARVDLNGRDNGTLALKQLLGGIEAEFQPDWVLIDARSGLSEAAGIVFAGIARLYVLLGNGSAQFWLGMRIVVRQLGIERIESTSSQADVVVVQTMIPPDRQIAAEEIERFEELAYDVFSDSYYLEADENSDNEGAWTMEDIESRDAPHRPEIISYNQRLMTSRNIHDIADITRTDHEYLQLAERIRRSTGVTGSL